MIEAAIVASILAFLLVSIMGGALYMRTYVAVDSAATAGARAGSVGATDSTADWDALKAIEKQLSSMNRESVKRIVVFKGTSPNAMPPSECDSVAPGSSLVEGKCNIYLSGDLARDRTSFLSPEFSSDDTWPASERQDSRTQGSDFIGVKITTDCDCILKDMGFSQTITKTTVMRVESRRS